MHSRNALLVFSIFFCSSSVALFVTDNQPRAVTLNSLFPAGITSNSWSTSSVAPSDIRVPLSDSTFRPTNMITDLAPQYVPAPDGVTSMRAHFPQGSVTYQSPRGGLSFYAPGPARVDLTKAKEVTLAYSVLFQSGFAFNMGGKLPGLYGGNSPSESTGCSGGERSDACFSARYMWRSSGRGELYTYLPPSFPSNQAFCTAPTSTCDATYGASVGRGSFTFVPGRRIAIAQRVRLNDVGSANGQIEVFVEGKSVIRLHGLVLRNSDAGRIRGIMMQTFFGGHTSEWASSKTQDVFFSDFSVAITQML